MRTLRKSEMIGRLASNKFTRVVAKGVYLIFYEIDSENIRIVSFGIIDKTLKIG